MAAFGDTARPFDTLIRPFRPPLRPPAPTAFPRHAASPPDIHRMGRHVATGARIDENNNTPLSADIATGGVPWASIIWLTRAVNVVRPVPCASTCDCGSLRHGKAAKSHARSTCPVQIQSDQVRWHTQRRHCCWTGHRRTRNEIAQVQNASQGYAALICLSIASNSAMIVANGGGVAINISTMPR